jgi:tetratricopeptide (TPR) repeat protein
MSKIIDTSEPVKQSRFHPKSLVVIALVVVVLLGVGALIITNQQKKSETAKNEESTLPFAAATNDKAKELASKDSKQALEYYDEQISVTSDKDEKAELLLGKAEIAYTAGDFDGALQAAKDADAIKSTAGTLGMIAQSYEAKGDKASALEYYKKALAILPDSEVSNRQEVTLQSKINELSKP